MISEGEASELTYAAAARAVLPALDVEPPTTTSGGTDFGILFDVFLSAGLSEGAAELITPSALFELERATTNLEHLGREREALRGASTALAALDDVGAMQSLVTGNSRPRAAAKLHAMGLSGCLDLRYGGFGDREQERWRLVATARALAGLICFADEGVIVPGRTFVIGDTVHDVRAARDAGVIAVAVGSGSTPIDTLAAERPDLLIENLEAGLDELMFQVAPR